MENNAGRVLRVQVAVLTTLLALGAWTARPRRRDERGDVPGWVFVTIMSAGLVLAITAVAQPQLTGMVQRALNSVK
jgi:hydrogenase/urease accessory protein HupE